MPINILPEDNIPASSDPEVTSRLGLTRIPRSYNDPIPLINAMMRILDEEVIRRVTGEGVSDPVPGDFKWAGDHEFTGPVTLADLTAVLGTFSSLSAALATIVNQTVTTQVVTTQTVTTNNVTTENVETSIVENQEVETQEVANQTVVQQTVTTQTVADATITEADVTNLNADTATIDDLNATAFVIGTGTVANQTVALQAVTTQNVQIETVQESNIVLLNATTVNIVTANINNYAKKIVHDSTVATSTTPKVIAAGFSAQVVEYVYQSIGTKKFIIMGRVDFDIGGFRKDTFNVIDDDGGATTFVSKSGVGEAIFTAEKVVAITKSGNDVIFTPAPTELGGSIDFTINYTISRY